MILRTRIGFSYPWGRFAFGFRATDITRRIEMLSQIRIYTINKGEMDAFLKHYKEEIIPVHERIGVPIIGTWVNRPQNEFIWIRTYTDKADLEAKGKAFQAEIAKAGIKLGANVAKMEVREVEMAFTRRRRAPKPGWRGAR